MLGGGVEFGTARQDILQGGAFFVAQGTEISGEADRRRTWALLGELAG
ncbi:hypothetical protein [Streptomyces alanosinicus]|nr:hypothetical protein [Streptomyces alanosinicus]